MDNEDGNTCPCGALVPRTGLRGRPARYCSPECRTSAQRALAAARRGPATRRTDGICPRCATRPRHTRPSGKRIGWCLPCEAQAARDRRVRNTTDGQG